MFDVILTTDRNNGMGYNGKLPWICKEDSQLFDDLTLNCVLVMGRKTVEQLPIMYDRTIWCITKDNNIDTKSYKNKVVIFNSMESVIKQSIKINKRVFIAGGRSIYNKIFSTYSHLINKVYWSLMVSYECDTFVKDWRHLFVTEKKIIYDSFEHYILIRKQHETQETMYLNILKDVYMNGCIKTGRNGNTKSLFGKTLTFDLRKGFPLLTTKKMFFRGIVEELLFFIRGETDSNILENKKINIWKGNTNRTFLDSVGKQYRKEGYMGPMYGYQWRYFNSTYNEKTSKPSSASTDYFIN